MKKTRVAINGFGRIGRISLRALLAKKNIDVVAINDLADTKTLAHLFKYDSIHGSFNGTISSSKDGIHVNGKEIKAYNQKDPSLLPWKDQDIDIVIESTGQFLDTAGAKKHLKAGAKKVILSAPPKEDDVKTIVLGVNENIISSSDQVLSNASCTTNCAAPIIKILEDNWGIEKCYVSTVHSYTTDQRLHDSPHKDLRRGRAAATSIIPTSTGAAKALTKIFPHLVNDIGGCGIRVPVANGSLIDITVIVKKPATAEQINSTFQKYAEGSMKGILEYTEDPIVSVDIIDNTHSCIFNADLTYVMGNMVKVLGWYDNESGYSARLADLVEKIG